MKDLTPEETVLLRETLVEYIATRGGMDEDPIKGIAQYVEKRYAHMSATFRDEKGRDVLRRVRMAKELRSRL